MSRTFHYVLLGLALSNFACSARRENDTPDDIIADSPVTVQVQNDYALPVEVFATGTSIRHRLGTVHPGMRGNFVLPRGLVGGGTVEFIATSGDGGAARSGPQIISPGAIVDFKIAPQLFNSTTTVRP